MRRFDLRGSHVLLSGAAGGIGSAVATRLHRAGARLVLTDRDGEALKVVAGHLDARRPPSCLVADFAAPMGVDGLVSQLQDRSLDVFIQCAGIAPGGGFEGQSAATIDAVLDINLRAAIALTHRLLPQLLAARHAAIVHVASGAGLLGPGGLAAYAASKFGLVGFSEALRAELRGRVYVSVVCPPLVRTDIIRNTAALAGGEPEDVTALHALVHRFGMDPDRVARAIINAIERNRGRVVVGVASRALLLARAVSPSLTDRVNHAVFRALSRRGTLS
ncbi:MAG: SDR family NAD(P)-dependent oxidoreductase [Deltaproteobacteria bacterium]|nr:SDR family NAD(P)-dependent oxidoreductase [Deltaproteobacteria bacterium]